MRNLTADKIYSPLQHYLEHNCASSPVDVVLVILTASLHVAGVPNVASHLLQGFPIQVAIFTPANIS